jgi:hypothetical protein
MLHRPKWIDMWNMSQSQWNGAKHQLIFFVKLSHNMPNRCQAVIDANGDHTKY